MMYSNVPVGFRLPSGLLGGEGPRVAVAGVARWLVWLAQHRFLRRRGFNAS